MRHNTEIGAGCALLGIHWNGWLGFRRCDALVTSRFRLCARCFCWRAAASGQTILPGSGPGGERALFNTDAAVLESQDPRKDLPCTATPVKPTLGFDLKFHSGYEVSVPLKELAGDAKSAHHDLPGHTRSASGRTGVHVAAGERSGDRRERARRRLSAGHLRRGRGQVSRGLADARPRRARVLGFLGYRCQRAAQGQAGDVWTSRRTPC